MDHFQSVFCHILHIFSFRLFLFYTETVSSSFKFFSIFSIVSSSIPCVFIERIVRIIACRSSRRPSSLPPLKILSEYSHISFISPQIHPRWIYVSTGIAAAGLPAGTSTRRLRRRPRPCCQIPASGRMSR